MAPGIMSESGKCHRTASQIPTLPVITATNGNQEQSLVKNKNSPELDSNNDTKNLSDLKGEEFQEKSNQNVSGLAASAASLVSSSTPTVCQNCETTTTPLWRRDENGQVLCNACGLFLKLHGRRRPISLKTDVIKSRNRSRNTAVPGIRRSKGSAATSTSSPHGQIHVPDMGSPSFSTLSPHIVPHGSPLRGPIGHDISHIDHLPMLGSHEYHRRSQVHQNGHSFQQHQQHHQQQPQQQQNYNYNTRGSLRHTSSSVNSVPSTPSTIFSYPNSPILGPHNPVSHINNGSSAPVSPRLQGHQSPNGVAPNTLPPLPRPQPLSLTAASSGNNSTTAPHIVLGSVTSQLSKVAANNNNNIGSNSITTTSTTPSVNVTSPLHILTPQSRPQSPTTSATAGTSLHLSVPRLAGVPRLNARGEALSEQLRPKSPPDARLERIPPLRQISTGGHNRILEASTVDTLHTRISELELVNDLFKSKVAQLEHSENLARQSEASIRQSELGLRKEIEELKSHNRALMDQLRRAGLAPVSSNGDGNTSTLPPRIPPISTTMSSLPLNSSSASSISQQNPTTVDEHVVKRIKVSDII